MTSESPLVEPRFVGESRKLLVEGLLAVFGQVRDTGAPAWVSLEAPSGAGKTRVAREFYARLAGDPGRQSDPPYWPASILGASADVPAIGERRKRVHPGKFEHVPRSLPSWMWWGIACYLRNGVPSFALLNDIAQLERHAPWWTAAWSRAAPLKSLDTRARDLRNVVSSWVKGTVQDKAFEAAVQLLIGSVPVLGAFKKVAIWMKDQLADEWRTHQAAAADVTVDPDMPKDDVVEDAFGLVRHLAVKGLPLVLFVEDLHLADDLLVKFLVKIVNSNCAVMIVTTGWLGDVDDEKNPLDLLLRGPLAEQIIRINDDGNFPPPPFPDRAGLGEFARDDLKEVVRHYYPRVDERTLGELVKRYRNPLELELVCLLPKHRREFRNGDLQLSDSEIAELPTGMRDVYAAMWAQLPEPVQWGFALAAIAQPAAIAPQIAKGDERWLPERLVAVAAAELSDMPEVAASLQGEGRHYAWARAVDVALRQFNEPVQREVALDQARDLYGRAKTGIYNALARELLAEADRPPAPQRLREHRARMILALYAQEIVSQPAMILEAAITLVLALLPFPREYPQLLDLIGNVRKSRTGGLSEDDPTWLRLRHYEVVAQQELGQLNHAITGARSLLEDETRVLKSNDPLTMETRKILVYALATNGKDREALAEGEKLLAQQLLWLNMHGLGAVMSGDLHRSLAAERERVERTVVTRNYIANIRARLGGRTQAIDELRELLIDEERFLQPNDPFTVTTRKDLALLRGEIPDFLNEAIVELQTLLDQQANLVDTDESVGMQRKRVTLEVRMSLATLLGRKGQVDDAMTIFRDVIETQSALLGADNPETLHSREWMAATLVEAYRFEDALKEFRSLRDDEIKNPSVGPDHKMTLESRAWIARLLGDLGASDPARYDEAYEEFSALLPDQERVFGRGSPGARTTRGSLKELRKVVKRP